MSEFDRAKTLLRRTAQDGSAAAGHVKYDTPLDGAARMLDTVDSAVLARRLVFDFGDGARLTCDASARRLVRLHAPAPAGSPAACMPLFDKPGLAATDAPELAGLLVDLCQRGTSFRLTSQAIDQAQPSQGGVDPAMIATALGLTAGSLPDTDAGQPHDAFLKALEPDLLAAILIENDEASLIFGDGTNADSLANWASTSLTPLVSPDFPLLGSLETNGLLIFTLPKGTERHILIAGRRGSFVVASINHGTIAATLAHWRQTNARDRAPA